MSMIFASSPGWKRTPPASTQSRAPFTGRPITGSAGSMSRPIAARPKRYL
jgi:hypothetical protein